eukprot:2294548-Pleurochrysis_carterae.AAC.1
MKEGARSDAIAAAKAEQKQHSDWFLAQRNELEKMRQSGESHETFFEQVRSGVLFASIIHTLTCVVYAYLKADKCGEDCLYTPGGRGRLDRVTISRSTPSACLSRLHRSLAVCGSSPSCRPRNGRGLRLHVVDEHPDAADAETEAAQL